MVIRRARPTWCRRLGEAGPSTPWPARRPDLAGLPVPGSAAGALRAAAPCEGAGAP